MVFIALSQAVISDWRLLSFIVSTLVKMVSVFLFILCGVCYLTSFYPYYSVYSIFCACVVMCLVQLNIRVYVRTPSGEALVSQLLSVHSPLYYLPETGIAWFVVIIIHYK